MYRGQLPESLYNEALSLRNDVQDSIRLGDGPAGELGRTGSVTRVLSTAAKHTAVTVEIIEEGQRSGVGPLQWVR